LKSDAWPKHLKNPISKRRRVLEGVYKSELYKVGFVVRMQEFGYTSRLVLEVQKEPWMTKNEMEPKETKREQTETGRTGRLSQGKPWEPLH
jgi:hypothetical protein